MQNLIVLVPDKDYKLTLAGLFSRFNILKIKPITYDIFVHPLHDPGVLHGAIDFLRPYIQLYDYALVLLDHEGSGQEQSSVAEICQNLKSKLEKNGWENRIEVIVLAPELEIWAWINSPYLISAIGWDDYGRLKKAIIQQQLWEENASKPYRPKEAFEYALKQAHIPRSSSIYREIAQKVNFTHCEDAAFNKLLSILRTWFTPQ